MKKHFDPGDKVAWRMPMDVYEGIVVHQSGDDVEIACIIGANDETHPDHETRSAQYLVLVRKAT